MICYIQMINKKCFTFFAIGVKIKEKRKGEITMAKVILDWKAPSESKMADFSETLSEELQLEFCNACAKLDDKGKVVINKSKAKKWLVEKFDGTGEIEWKNRPVQKAKKLSGAERIGRFLKKQNGAI